nr:hypothetical protein [Tanacetum cinerariifolium]
MGRFVTAVKLNRGLRDSNNDQLYAYLKQHETHANKNKMMLDRFTQHTVDPLALMSNVLHQQHYSQSFLTLPSTYVPPNLADNAYLYSGLSLMDNLIKNLTNTLALLTQSYKTFIPQTNNQLRTSLNIKNQAIVQDGRVVDLALNVDNMFQADDYDAFHSDVDEALMAQTMFMSNLSFADPVNDEVGPSHNSDILSECVKDNAVPFVHSNVSSVPNDAYMMIYNDMYEPHAQSASKTSQNTVVENSLTTELATYKEPVELYERRASVQEMLYSEQTHLVNYLENEILSIYFETQNAVVRDTNSSTQQDAMILYVFEQLSNQVTNCNKVNKDNLIANESLSVELERYKEQVKLLEERQDKAYNG